MSAREDDMNARFLAFEVCMRGLTRKEIGTLLITTVLEADHQGWEGYNDREVNAISKFLEDVARTGQSMSKEDYERPFFTGTHYAHLNDDGKPFEPGSAK